MDMEGGEGHVTVAMEAARGGRRAASGAAGPPAVVCAFGARHPCPHLFSLDRRRWGRRGRDEDWKIAGWFGESKRGRKRQREKMG
jgi:hypothetical protein